MNVNLNNIEYKGSTQFDYSQPLAERAEAQKKLICKITSFYKQITRRTMPSSFETKISKVCESDKEGCLRKLESTHKNEIKGYLVALNELYNLFSVVVCNKEANKDPQKHLDDKFRTVLIPIKKTLLTQIRGMLTQKFSSIKAETKEISKAINVIKKDRMKDSLVPLE